MHNHRLQLLRNTIPSLFTHPGTLLYIGISKERADCLQELYDAGHLIMALEAFRSNVYHYQSDERLVDIIHGDVCNVDKLFIGPFDTTFWWHGPEHIEKHELASTVTKLENITTHLVVLSGPWGRSKHGEHYGNPYEAHLWSLYSDDFTELGYQVVTGGKPHTQHKSALIAWKQIS